MGYEINLTSVYVFVNDLECATKFYEQIFNQKAQDNTFFVGGGIRFWLFDYQAANDNRAVFGHNCLPSFQVSDIKCFMEKLEELHAPIVFPLTLIGNSWVLEFTDTEGNDIEVWQQKLH
ncbi:MAG: VOC family protein [Defluviitaleaceae bacterium]|nr:VOC family protein [Defluviitaleaceae bacterium]MCL2274190.1 VOC family protein [Defluviitaleaceae bacterium]